MRLLSTFLFILFSSLLTAAPANYFVPNKGQLSDMKGNKLPDIKYKYEGEGLNLYFQRDKLIYHFIKVEDKQQQDFTPEDHENFRKGNMMAIGKKVYFYRLDLNFKDANKDVVIEEQDETGSVSNYYLNSCPDGILNVSHFGRLVYRNLYDGIDLAFYFAEGKLKYDFIVLPGADISKIKLEYVGAESLEKSSAGELVVKTPVATITEGSPYTFVNGTGIEVPSEYIVEGSTLSFEVNGSHAGEGIVIDPTVTWSTYYNNGSSSDTWTKPDFDNTGAFYNTGYTYYTTFPLINAGAGQYFDGTKDGITDLVVVKFSSTYTYTWATYYGGDGGEYVAGYTDYGKALAVDASNNVYFAGQTDGTTFPTYNPGGAFYQDQTKIHGETPFVVKLNSNGVRLWASMFQHENANTMSSGMRMNGIYSANNNLYFTGQIYRFNSNDAPIRSMAGAYNNPTWKGPQDVFIGRFTSGNALEWCTYLNDGGLANASYRQGCDLTMDNSGNLWFVGRHTSSAANAGHYLLNPGGGAYYQGVNNGDQDLIITKFNSSMNVVYSTYYGGNDQDIPSMVECNSTGDAVFTLRACRSTNFPVFDPGGGAYYQPVKAYISAFDSDAALVKLSTGGIRQWATYYGGSGGPSLFSGVGFDGSNNIYVFGSTQASNFPTQSEAGSYNDATLGGTGDVVLLKFSNGGVRQWSTFYGGSGTESLYSPKGEVLSSGCSLKLLSFPYSNSADYPTTNPGGGAFFESTALTANANAIMLFEETSAGGNSTAPTSASATAATVCSGGATTLSVTGGSLGAGAAWTWYSTSCGGTLVGTGATLVVNPTSTTTYYVRAEGTCNTTTCASVTVTVNASSTAPTSASATAATVCSGGATTLSVTGGSLGAGAAWTWYSTSCGGTLVGTGATLVVNPTATTTYYVRAEGTCNTTTCASVTVTVDASSTAPTSASASAPALCGAGSSTLSVSGGSLGAGASWTWYEGSCNGTPAGTGNSITVSPTSTTTYFVNAVGTCNTTICESVTVTVSTPSTAPTSVSGTQSTVCSGVSSTLTVNGGSLGTGATWSWYSASCGGTLQGTGTSITVTPGSTTTYYVRAEGACNTTTCESFTVTVDSLSSAPTSVTASVMSVCPTGSSTLGITGGSLGTGASWNWYEGSCTGTLIGTGSSIVVSPSATTSYFVKAEGLCNTTACEQVTITLNTLSTESTTASSNVSSICPSGSATLTTGGGSLGTNAVWNWYESSCGGTLAGSGSSIAVSPAVTTTYFVRAEGDCNSTVCDTVVVIVDEQSVAPVSITSSSPSVCTGNNVTLYVNGGILGTGASWNWYSGSCNSTVIGTGDSLTIPVNAATDYFVNAVGACNTTSCSQISIAVTPGSTLPTSLNLSADTVCPGSPVTITMSGEALEPGATWTWYSTNCGGTSIGTGNSIVVNPASATTYFVRAEGGSCGNSACTQVTVNVHVASSDPVNASSNTTLVCSGSSVDLSVSGGTVGTDAQYTWYEGSCNSAPIGNGSTLTVNPTVNTTYYVNLAGLCNTTNCQQVTISMEQQNVAPTGILANDTNLCTSSSITLAVDGGVLGSGAQWTWYENACNGTVVGSGSSISVSPSAATTYYVSAIGGCNAIPCVSESIVATPVAAAWTAPSGSLCSSVSAVDLNTYLSTGTPTGGSWIGQGVSGTMFDPSGLNGSITISYVLGSGICKDSVANTIQILASPVAPVVTASNDSVCSGNDVTLDASGSGTGVIYEAYDAAVSGTLLGTMPLTVNPTSTTTYYIQSVNSSGCVNDGGRQPVVIFTSAEPAANAGSDVMLCLGESTTLSASGGGSYLWSNGETQASTTVTPSTDSTFIVAVTVDGCTASDSVVVNVVMSTDVEAADDHATTDHSVEIKIDVASNDQGDPASVSITTSPLGGTATVNAEGDIVYTPSPTFAGTDSIVYSICHLSCASICTTATVYIIVNKEVTLSVPGGISPNGDGINDEFRIRGLEKYPENTLIIFNRWGDEVFSAAPYQNNWKGQSENAKLKLLGNEVVDGTYFYILRLSPEDKGMNGTIELIRK